MGGFNKYTYETRLNSTHLRIIKAISFVIEVVTLVRGYQWPTVTTFRDFVFPSSKQRLNRIIANTLFQTLYLLRALLGWRIYIDECISDSHKRPSSCLLPSPVRRHTQNFDHPNKQTTESTTTEIFGTLSHFFILPLFLSHFTVSGLTQEMRENFLAAISGAFFKDIDFSFCLIGSYQS